MTDVAQVATPEAATARLAELSKNQEWSSKVLARDPASFAEFQALTKTVAGNTAALAEATTAANDAKLVSDYLASPPAGWPDASSPAGKDLAEILQGKPITPELHQAVRKKLDELTADAGWRARFDAKDQTALKEFYLATTLLSAGVKTP